MTIPHAVIITSIAWAAFATALVAYEKWAARREWNSWADHAGDQRLRKESAELLADQYERRAVTAEIALRHFRQGVEAGVSHSVNTLNAARIAARSGEPFTTAHGGTGGTPGSWKS